MPFAGGGRADDPRPDPATQLAEVVEADAIEDVGRTARRKSHFRPPAKSSCPSRQVEWELMRSMSPSWRRPCARPRPPVTIVIGGQRPGQRRGDRGPERQIRYPLCALMLRRARLRGGKTLGQPGYEVSPGRRAEVPARPARPSRFAGVAGRARICSPRNVSATAEGGIGWIWCSGPGTSRQS